jgi:cyanophycin synthetase
LPTTVLNSRRLTGPGLLLDGPGAVLDVRLEGADVDPAIAAWQRAALRLLAQVGWQDQILVARRFPGGVSLALTAPPDCLYAATELNDKAWEAAAAELEGQPVPDYLADVGSLRSAVAAECNPALVALRRAAQDRGLTFLNGEDLVSVGSGTGALVWPVESFPDPAEVDWSRVHDVPIALVTGSNGKTTVVRLLAEMVRESGRTPGYTSTEGVIAGTTPIGEGDFSGPSGARLVLRHPEVETAILETARGGILRRGLAVERANAALVTNVAEDHLGEFGVETLAQLADTKLVVAKALHGGGTLVLNADDPMLVERHEQIRTQLTWFSLDPSSRFVAAHVSRGGTAVLAEGGSLVVVQGSARDPVIPLAEIPITFGGSAEHNVANALAATAVGAALGIGVEPMAAALRRFGRNAGDNPGRANLIEVGGVRVLIDYVHNPHGMMALGRLVERLPGGRRLIMLGQAGDRGDEAIRQLARAAWSLGPHHVVVKDMGEYLRGRAPGEVPALLSDEFSRLGAEPDSISRVGPDIDGVRVALEWAQPADLLVLAVHQDRPGILDFLDRVKATGWHAGEPVPA